VATTTEQGSASRPTLVQVARLAGVSLKTASRVLNDEPYVSAATAAKVQAAAEELGFRLNVIARELRAGARSSIVGLIISDLANPFYARIARGAERVLRANDLQLICASSDEDPVLERQLTAELLERRVSALLLTTCVDDHRYLEVERRLGIPIAFLDRPPAGIDADTISLDNAEGARQAAEHLIQHGHRRIGLVGDLSRLATHRERIAGFAKAMADAGIDGWQRFVRADSHDSEAAERATRELMALPQPPTALFTTNNRITAGALRALRQLPSPPALIGFDDFDLAELLGVSVISHSPERMGELAVELVLERLAGAERPASHHRLPIRLIERGSGERGVPASSPVWA
jgi:LacI family transcriptional regulator